LIEQKRIPSVKVKRLGIPDTFVEHGPQDFLRRKYEIDAAGIFRAAEALLQSAGNGNAG
jgi:1-deoxy-D-xylulose-5-phosphate synthase